MDGQDHDLKMDISMIDYGNHSPPHSIDQNNINSHILSSRPVVMREKSQSPQLIHESRPYTRLDKVITTIILYYIGFTYGISYSQGLSAVLGQYYLDIVVSRVMNL